MSRIAWRNSEICAENVGEPADHWNVEGLCSHSGYFLGTNCIVTHYGALKMVWTVSIYDVTSQLSVILKYEIVLCCKNEEVKYNVKPCLCF